MSGYRDSAESAKGLLESDMVGWKEKEGREQVSQEIVFVVCVQSKAEAGSVIISTLTILSIRQGSHTMIYTLLQ